ncbi:MAG: hypothetical protein ACD_11C00105G0006 [uncultured bacterium]|nr:MAG: hypothetical protein ACD_11C00105G0006 [uncultured bacterium]HBR71720.1 hypothetical protein [Candidatus Moranbacteria bacterium]
MLYFILPPIIMIVSLALLIFFLFRKVSRVSTEKLEFLDSEKNDNSKSIGKKIFSFISYVWFKFLEKVMQRTKLFSLKMHNTSNNWFHSIKKKREETALRNQENEQIQEDAPPIIINTENVIPEEKKEEVVKKRITLDTFKKKSVLKSYENKNSEGEEKKKTSERSRLEEALIKRIAINPKDIEAYERLGDYYMDSVNHIDAKECYRQVLKLSPNHFKAKSKLRALERILKG